MQHTEDLTDWERLLLHRRRLGLTQVEMADRQGVSMRVYVARELGRRKFRARTFRGMLKDHEICFIGRRRAGVSRRDVAAILGVSQNWITLMERGRCDCRRLLELWNQRWATA